MSISSLPLFNGFVSEWLAFQTALQADVLDNGILRSLIPVAAAALALTAALGAACFVKVYGMIFWDNHAHITAKKLMKSLMKPCLQVLYYWRLCVF